MRWRIGSFLCGVVLAAAPAAHAQDGGSIGIGPRVTFQSGDADVPDSSTLRLLGGQLRLRLTPKLIVELSADYKASLNENLTQRAKTVPVQASVLYSPMSAAGFSPYAIGGLGWFNHSVTQVARPPLQVTSHSIREMGYHAGIGAEIRAGNRIAIHGDYRYTHIRFGGDPSSETIQLTPGQAIGILIPQLTPLQESLKVSHQGSTLNWGLTFFF